MKDKKAPTNTRKDLLENPKDYLAIASVLGSGEMVYRTEAQGMESFIESDTLPTEIAGVGGNPGKAILESSGVKFLGEVEGDKLFQYVELPAGWKKVAGNDPRECSLVDDRGQIRGKISYKAAPYDRWANMVLENRFVVGLDYNLLNDKNIVVAQVKDCSKPIYCTKPVKLPKEGRTDKEVKNQSTRVAIEWLENQYPDWRNPGAYWD